VKLEQSFEVAAPIDRVWAALTDLQRVAPCLPGAAITEHTGDGTYHGTFEVKLGPTTAAYRGTIKIESADESTHTATLKARGTDERGQGDASATIVNTLAEHDGATTVHAETDFTITGPEARADMMRDISSRLLRDFSTCLQSRLADAPTAPSGEEVTRGEAAPEAVAAAAPEGEMDAEAAAASAGATTAGTSAQPAPPPPAPPVAAKPAGGTGLWERVRRRFGRSPLP
jgi:carbon monoxide dehydrogenase subunit G